jgi:hypothetical protein
MTKNIASFPRESPKEVVERLLNLGLTLRNPGTGQIVAFSDV